MEHVLTSSYIDKKSGVEGVLTLKNARVLPWGGGLINAKKHSAHLVGVATPGLVLYTTVRRSLIIELT